MTYHDMRKLLGIPAVTSALGLLLLASGCGAQTASTETALSTDQAQSASSGGYLSQEDIPVSETLENSEDGGHAILADGESASYTKVLVNKTGEAQGDEADFYGDNAAVLATNGAALSLDQVVVKTDGTHANGVFSYGEGTAVTVSNAYIETQGNCSGGLMTTGGGVMNAENLTIHTYGNSSAAIRSDRGGGTVTVTGGSYTTEGVGSPAVYSTADITVSDAELSSTASQGIVVEGKNSVTLKNVSLTADNNSKNSDKSDRYQAVMIYQSMSGDADEGLASFTMEGGSLTNYSGDVFFVNNTVAQIDLSGVEIDNQGEGIFLRAEAAGWGSEGANGGQVTLNASGQSITGDMTVDSVSTLNLSLAEGSDYTGSINPDGAAGAVYVSLSEGSTWTLTGDAYITSLRCDADAIDCNGHTLYVDGSPYSEGSAAEGSPVQAKAVGGGQGGEDMPQGELGQPPEKPEGEASAPESSTGGESSAESGASSRQGGKKGGRPSRPGGDGSAPEGEPPARPEGKAGGTPPQQPEDSQSPDVAQS